MKYLCNDVIPGLVFGIYDPRGVNCEFHLEISTGGFLRTGPLDELNLQKNSQVGNNLPKNTRLKLKRTFVFIFLYYV